MLLATAAVLWRADALMECKERDIRVLGVILQGIGFGSVGAGLRDTGLHFGTPDFMALLRGYWAARPFFRRRRSVVVESQGLSAGASLSAGRARGTAGPGASIEQRVDAREREIAAHDDEIGRLGQTQRETKANLEMAIADEATKRSQADAEVRGTISSTIAQGITLEWLGVGFFVVGMVLSSVAPEIATLFGHPHSCDRFFTFWGWRTDTASPLPET